MERRMAQRIGARAEETSAIRRHRPDYWLLILTALLLTVGLIVIYSIGPALNLHTTASENHFVNRQLIAIGLSMVAFAVAATIPLSVWRRAYKPLLIIAAVATLIALVLPVNVQYPAHRWIRLGAFSFQSVELLKFAILIWLAGLLANRIKHGEIAISSKTLQPLMWALLVIGFVVAGVQSDLGSMGVIVAIMGAMAFVAGMPLRRILIIGVIVVFGAFMAISTSAYRRERLATYLHPSTDCLTTGYQACQALIAVGSGGIVGLGLGRSVQAYGYLPEAANDSIFAIYAEKFGFIGSVALLALFAGLFTRIKNIIERTTDDFTRLIVVGVLTWLSVQTIINVGAMIGVLPLKGITLPLISYGGTSVVFVMAALGLVFQASRYTLHRPVLTEMEGQYHENRTDRRRFRGAYHPASSSRP